jgi:hypothetical protein
MILTGLRSKLYLVQSLQFMSYMSCNRIYYIWTVYLLSTLMPLSAHTGQISCNSIFSTAPAAASVVLFDDPREQYELLAKTRQQPLFMKFGEGNSAVVYLTKNSNGEFHVIKIYKPEYLAKQEYFDPLKRDRDGLKEVYDFFAMDRQHSPQLRVAEARIITLPDGQRALDMPFVPGINLHKLLVETSDGHPFRQTAIELYNQMIEELHKDAQRLGLKDEVRVESDKYFQDHRVDGLMMLRVEGKPPLLIKTDNIIFNPNDNSLTLIDPY